MSVISLESCLITTVAEQVGLKNRRKLRYLLRRENEFTMKLEILSLHCTSACKDTSHKTATTLKMRMRVKMNFLKMLMFSILNKMKTSMKTSSMSLKRVLLLTNGERDHSSRKERRESRQRVSSRSATSKTGFRKHSIKSLLLSLIKTKMTYLRTEETTLI
jgi:hypothetical protein